jgi:sugar transferase (PEP-CTERM/EpsH1 system associated)
MKILFLAHRTPFPPDKGDKIRSFHLFSHLARSHKIAAVYFVDDPKDFAHTTFLHSLCRGRVIPVRLSRVAAMCRGLFSLLRGRSFSEGYYSAKEFGRAVEEARSDGPFDAVYVFSSAVASFAKTVAAPARVVDFVDVDSDKWGQLSKRAVFPLSLFYALEQKRLARWEVEISRWATASLFVAAADAELFKIQGGTGNIEVLPNGVDLELRRLPLEQVPFDGAGQGSPDALQGPKLIFIGTMNYYPNIDAVHYFVKEIFPLVRARFPRAVFEIVGRYPPRSVRRLQRFSGVQVLGEVPDVRSHLIRADVSVAPLRIARGVQNKVLEAMGMGVPVVATPEAIQGIEVCDGQEVLAGRSSSEFADQVIRLLSDAELRKALTRRAWSKVKQAYNWEASGARLERLLGGAVKSPPESKSAGASTGQG